MINLVSYFEIGGHVHECESYGPTMNMRSPLTSTTMNELARELPGQMKKSISSRMSYTERATEALKQGQTSRRQKFGATLMRWSVGGLLVPDPLPLVDELLFGTTFVIGAVLYATD